MQPKLLLTPGEKMDFFELWKFDSLIIQNFTAQFSEILPEDFIQKVLVEKLNTKLLVVGENFRYGFGARGDVSLLRTNANFETMTSPLLDSEGQSISSSRIRELIGRGDVARANELLGYSTFLNGRVVAGAGRGRQIGFPTLNLETDRECLPANGVYAGMAVLDGGNQYKAAVNLGINPSFHGTQFKIEVHLLDYDVKSTPRSVRLYFMKRLRDEMKFESVDRLKAQIDKDVQICGKLDMEIKLLKGP